MLGLTFSSRLDWGSYIVSVAKTASKKIGALIPWSLGLKGGDCLEREGFFALTWNLYKKDKNYLQCFAFFLIFKIIFFEI